MTRVCHLIDTLGIGGTERGLVSLLPMLRTMDVQGTVVCLSGPYDLREDLERGGIRVASLGLRHRRQIPLGLVRLLRFLREERPDIVHSRLFFSCLLSSVTRCLTPGIVRVASFHNETFIGFPPNTTWKKVRLGIESVAMRYCMDATAAISEAVKTHHEAFLKLRGIHVIPNAFDLKSFENVEPRSVWPDGEVVRLLMAGRFVEQKGHMTLLKACALLRNRGTNVSVVLVGEGPTKQAIGQEVKKMGLTNVAVLEVMPQAELYSVIAASDVVLMPSNWEGFGRSAAEAMALGKPVIASRVGGLCELIEDGESGVLVPVGDHVEFAAAIERLAAAPEERRRLGDNARRRVANRFGVEACAAAYKELYCGLLSRNGAAVA